eukprot:2347035-Pyramimonas_sp.AAC.1
MTEAPLSGRLSYIIPKATVEELGKAPLELVGVDSFEVLFEKLPHNTACKNLEEFAEAAGLSTLDLDGVTHAVDKHEKLDSQAAMLILKVRCVVRDLAHAAAHVNET